MDQDTHEPVLVEEVMNALHIKTAAWYIDGTVGGGGHSAEIIKRGGNVLGLDMDISSLQIAKRTLSEACSAVDREVDSSFTLVHANFKDIDAISHAEGIDTVSGVLLDLGVSTMQLTSSKRGLSFGNPTAPLDMRMNPDVQSVTAADLVNALREEHLAALFETVMDWSGARGLAKKIVRVRDERRFKTVGDLLTLLPEKRLEDKVHPATKPMMALRMAVNSEMENLKDALPRVLPLLEEHGRLVIITFHSLEDGIVKDVYRTWEKEGMGTVVTKKPIEPSEKEKQQNAKSRSAKLRVFEKHTTNESIPSTKTHNEN